MAKKIVYKATLKQKFHKQAYKEAGDDVRCMKCASLKEPCAECKSVAATMQDLKREREGR